MINFEAIKAIYKFEMARTFRTIIQSIISPVLSTILYFIVFGTAAPGIEIMNKDLVKNSKSLIKWALCEFVVSVPTFQ